MIITKTPFRMSFFGGGTDMESYFKEHGGAVLSTTFDKYCYVTVRHLPRFFDYTTELSYSKTERVTSVEDIQHPAIRNAMKMLDMHELRLVYEADLPARSGLGTSSSFAVGMLNAFYALKGKYADKRRLADEAIYLERVLCDEAGGWQDQIAAAFGGFNRIDFTAGGYEVRPVILSPERKQALNDNLMMFFTGFTRFSAHIQQQNNLTAAEKVAQLKQMHALVDEAERVLVDTAVPLGEFGRLLDTTWRLKRGTSSAISTEGIDALYEKALAAGAVGGKLLGAGGGGFLLFYVEKEKQAAVRAALADLLYVPFAFEDGGTRVIHYTPEGYTPREV
ncbi:MAG: kinase [Ruminococcaceae bacterium]|nr:kinase [Oscillospiraceae bacterium]